MIPAQIGHRNKHPNGHHLHLNANEQNNIKNPHFVVLVDINVQIDETHGHHVDVHNAPKGADEQEEVVALVVVETHAILDEHAVMVHFVDAGSADRAVVYALGLDSVLGDAVLRAFLAYVFIKGFGVAALVVLKVIELDRTQGAGEVIN